MIRINLLPRVPRRRLPGRQWLEIGIPVVALLAAVGFAVSIGIQNRGLAAEEARVGREIAELRPVVERVLQLDRQIADMREKERVINSLIQQQLPASSILNEIRLLIPQDAWLTGLNVPEPSALSIEGYAMTYPIVAQLMDNLRAGQLFESVDLTVAQAERIGPREVVKFSVTARIQKPQATGGDRP
jgi:Tfp pilus assembly protein PilN